MQCCCKVASVWVCLAASARLRVKPQATPVPVLPPTRCCTAPSHGWQGSAWLPLMPTATCAMEAWWCPLLEGRLPRQMRGEWKGGQRHAVVCCLCPPLALVRLHGQAGVANAAPAPVSPCTHAPSPTPPPAPHCLQCCGGAADRFSWAQSGVGAEPRDPAGRRQHPLHHPAAAQGRGVA